MRGLKKAFILALCVTAVLGLGGCSSIKSEKRIVRISHGVYGAWHESYPFWYHADLQPLYRNHHTACGHHTVCGRQGGKGEDRDGIQTAFDLFCSNLRCTYAGNLYPAAQSLAAKSDGICIK